MGLKYFTYLIVAVSFAYFLGCDNQQASYSDTGFGGTIIDSSTKRGLPGVSVTVTQLNYSTLTDSNGFFYIGKIGVPSSAGNFNVTCTKSGYDPVNFLAVLYAGDTTKRVNFAMHNPANSVFTVNNLVVYEHLNPQSNSFINLYHLFVTSDTIWYNLDVFLTDSANTRTNFSFLSSTYAPPIYGHDTRFTNLLGYYSQSEFDTLSRIDVGPRNIDPSIDFPKQMTNSFNAPLTQSPVYGFFLAGRYYYATGYPRVYGLLRIESFYFDNQLNSYIAVVDVKINRNEQNYFLVN